MQAGCSQAQQLIRQDKNKQQESTRPQSLGRNWLQSEEQTSGQSDWREKGALGCNQLKVNFDDVGNNLADLLFVPLDVLVKLV